MTPTQTEAHVEGNAEIQARPGGILAQIRVGFLLQFESIAFPNTYAVAAAVPGFPPLVLVGPRPGEPGTGVNPTFLVTMYSYDGQSQAKISLRSSAAPMGFWAVGRSIPPQFTNPISIADQPGEFILTDTGNGISIQNIHTPPNPYIRRVPPGISPYLAYGYSDPGGKPGLFNISIVG